MNKVSRPIYYDFISGDPEDTHLRIVEKDILIPNMIKKKANTTWCEEANKGAVSLLPVLRMTCFSFLCFATKVVKAAQYSTLNKPQ